MPSLASFSFQSTQPEWAATGVYTHKDIRQLKFQSTQPEWAATPFIMPVRDDAVISIHAARMGCDGNPSLYVPELEISIHAARMGCDFFLLHYFRVVFHLNPRSPSGLRPKMKAKLPTHKKDLNPRSPSGLRPFRKAQPLPKLVFKSTQPEWAATERSKGMDKGHIHLNPRSPRGLRHKSAYPQKPVSSISIHAAQEGCDNDAKALITPENIFQSTQPKRAATVFDGVYLKNSLFQSTQPKRAATESLELWEQSQLYFNPRSPRGLRLSPACPFLGKKPISIHAAQEGCDQGN